MARCSEEGCQILITGKCINDLEIDECPHYYVDDEGDDEFDDNISEDEDLETEPIDANVIDVYSGRALNLEEVNRISRSSLTRLVILAGLPDAGKTTLLLSLMHLFQTKTSFQGFLFAGSQTLLDFEEKSHPSTITSEKESADTNRTPIGPPTFLHLKVAENDNVDKTTDLLFTDISGELFVSLKDNRSEAQNFTICNRADHFAIFFDSKRITSVKERANARTSGLGILRSLNEAGTLLPHTRIQVIFSRWDLFSGIGDREKHNEFIELLKQDISNQFGEFYKIDFFEVSARPKDSALEFGYGIDQLFPVWVVKSLLDLNKLSPPTVAELSDRREFLQYKYNQ